MKPRVLLSPKKGLREKLLCHEIINLNHRLLTVMLTLNCRKLWDFGERIICWWLFHGIDDFFIFKNWSPTSQIGYQHLKLVTNTFDLQHPLPTSMQSDSYFNSHVSNQFSTNKNTISTHLYSLGTWLLMLYKVLLLLQSFVQSRVSVHIL